MPLPERFESHRGFVIRPHPVQSLDTSMWTIGGFIHPEAEADQGQEESFHAAGKSAKSYEEAVNLAVQFGKQVIDKRLGS